MLEELVQELGLNEEQTQKLNDAVTKLNQSETDKVRTEYSKKIKELEKYKPIEKSETELELEKVKKELADTKFKSDLKTLGVDDNLAKYIRSDIDMEEFSSFYKGFVPKNQTDFIPNSKNSTGDAISKDDFLKMSYSEKAKLYTENPQLYQQLAN